VTSLNWPRPRFQLHLAWVPGHNDVKMNEVVGVEAKQAAEGLVTSTTIKYNALKGDLPISIAAAKKHHKKLVAAEWSASWKDAPRRTKMARFDKSAPTKRILKLYDDLPRRSCSIFTQLRTGHIGLNKFLYRIGAVDSPLCARCQSPRDCRSLPSLMSTIDTAASYPPQTTIQCEIVPYNQRTTFRLQ